MQPLQKKGIDCNYPAGDIKSHFYSTPRLLRFEILKHDWITETKN